MPITEIGMSVEAPCLCAVGAGNSKFYFGHVKIEISLEIQIKLLSTELNKIICVSGGKWSPVT